MHQSRLYPAHADVRPAHRVGAASSCLPRALVCRANPNQGGGGNSQDQGASRSSSETPTTSPSAAKPRSTGARRRGSTGSQRREQWASLGGSSTGVETTPEQRLHRAVSRGDVAAVREALAGVATLEARCASGHSLGMLGFGWSVVVGAFIVLYVCLFQTIKEKAGRRS